jgi:membrane fusion protein (multidrug efflux system)
MATIDNKNNTSPAAVIGQSDEGDETIESVPFYTRKRVVIPLLLFVAAVVAAVLVWYIGYTSYVSTDDAFIDGNRVTVSSKYQGRIDQMTVDEGSSVKKGDVLVRLDDSDLRAQEEQAKAAVVSAEQNLILAGVNASRTEEDFNRARLQFKDHIIPKEQFDHAQKALEAARAQNAIAVAQVATAKAQRGVIETQLANTVIVAPMDGVVAKRWALAGDVVQPAQPILSVYDLDHLWVTANFEETKYASIALNHDVAVDVDTYGGKSFDGKVIQLGANTASQFSLIPPNNASGNFTKVTQRIPVKISLNNPHNVRLLPGMSVEVKIRKK